MADKLTDLARYGAGSPVRKPGPRKATSELLADSAFDRSLAATRQRLMDALAITSEVALRQAENGTGSNTLDLLKDAAQIYRQLVASDDPTEQRPGETEEAYRLRLEAAAR